jgi:hypothetical protein
MSEVLRQAAGFATVTERAPRGMITLRADLAAAETAAALAASGFALPEPRRIEIGRAHV